MGVAILVAVAAIVIVILVVLWYGSRTASSTSVGANTSPVAQATVLPPPQKYTIDGASIMAPSPPVKYTRPAVPPPLGPGMVYVSYSGSNNATTAYYWPQTAAAVAAAGPGTYRAEGASGATPIYELR